MNIITYKRKLPKVHCCIYALSLEKGTVIILLLALNLCALNFQRFFLIKKLSLNMNQNYTINELADIHFTYGHLFISTH